MFHPKDGEDEFGEDFCSDLLRCNHFLLPSSQNKIVPTSVKFELFRCSEYSGISVGLTVVFQALYQSLMCARYTRCIAGLFLEHQCL